MHPSGARARRLGGQRPLEFFHRVRNAYLERAAADPGRYRIVDASGGIEAVRARVQAAVDDLP